jgi:hypothetical protein
LRQVSVIVSELYRGLEEKRRTVSVFMNDSFSRKEVLIASSEFEKQEEPPSV